MLVTPDELEPLRRGNADDMAMTATVNGRPYSSGNFADIHWSFGAMIEDLREIVRPPGARGHRTPS